jgi:hypothetical protein
MQANRDIRMGLAAAGLVGFLFVGCFLKNETIGSGEASRSWLAGKLSKTYRADYERVWQAAAGAVRDLRLDVESEEHDGMVGRLRARRADDLSVRLDVDNAGGGQAKVVIWVGAVGKERDKQCAMTLMDAIDRKLGL